jgi:cytochrome c biogenesis protein CcdA
VTDGAESPRRSLFHLLASLPGLIGELLRAEIAALKAEIKERAIRAGIGIGLLVAALFFLFVSLLVAIFAAIAGIATVLPLWASALIVFGGLLVIAIVLAFVGIASLKSSGRLNRINAIGDDLHSLSRAGRAERHAATDGES